MFCSPRRVRFVESQYAVPLDSVAVVLQELRAWYERIVAEHGGRPHWGKQHTLGVDQLRRVHPRLDDFLAVRDRLDPTRVLVHILGT